MNEIADRGTVAREKNLLFPKKDRKKVIDYFTLVNMHMLTILLRVCVCLWLEICQNVGGKLKVKPGVSIYSLYINRIVSNGTWPIEE